MSVSEIPRIRKRYSLDYTNNPVCTEAAWRLLGEKLGERGRARISFGHERTLTIHDIRDFLRIRDDPNFPLWFGLLPEIKAYEKALYGEE